LNNFLSQALGVVGMGVGVTVHYSQNMYDQTGGQRQGPDVYGKPGAGQPLPDSRVAGTYALRVTRDIIDTGSVPPANPPITPATVVLSFSEPVFVREFLVGSLSILDTWEHAVIRAFGSADATGPVIKASSLWNASALTDGSSLAHGLWDATGPNFGAANKLSNLAVDPQLTLNPNGLATNAGSPADDGVYHLYGKGYQGANEYGRAILKWETSPVQSIAISGFSDGDSFNSTVYDSGRMSFYVGPVSFAPVPEPEAYAAICATVLGGFAVVRRLRQPKLPCAAPPIS